MRVVILVLAMLAVYRVGFTQKQFIGLKMGPASTNVGGDFFKDTKIRIGLNIRLTYDYFLSNNLSFGTEVMYSQRGFRETIYLRDDQNNDLGSETSKFNFDYIGIPLTISYNGNKNLYPFGSVGLVPAFLVSAKTQIPTVGVFEGGTYDVKEKVAAVDIAGIIEIGAGYNLTEQYKVFTSLSGQLSLTKFSSDEYFENESMRHYGFTLAVGMKYVISP